MNVRLLPVLGAVAALATLVACPSSTNLGKPCNLAKPNPDGGAPGYVTVDDIKNISNQDIITFGSFDCDNDACIVDAAHLETARAQAAANGGAVKGYCSQKCTTDSECKTQYDGTHKTSDPLFMGCKQLLLDQATINALCTSDETCENYFGSTKDKVTPDFCARTNPPDAGT